MIMEFGTPAFFFMVALFLLMGGSAIMGKALSRSMPNGRQNG